MHNSLNQFQLNADTLEQLLNFQLGLSFSSNTSALACQWRNSNNEFYQFTGIIQTILREGDRVYLTGYCDDGVPFKFPPVFFLDLRTRVKWRKVPQFFYDMWVQELQSSSHLNSMERASQLIDTYIATNTSSSKDVVLTLDGNGENRYAMTQRLNEVQIGQRPKLYTVEMDPQVALANKLMFGESIIFAGADPSLKTKSLLGDKVLLEHLILKQNALLSDEMKKNVTCMYLDYCGGPPGNQTPDKCKTNLQLVCDQLPKLKYLGMTMSYRKHGKNLKYTIDTLIPSAFASFKTFTNNKRVLCKLYEKRQTSVSNCGQTRRLQSDLDEFDVHLNPPQTRKYICSTCGEVGHNKRTCTFTPDIPPLVPVLASHHSNVAGLSPAPRQPASTPNSNSNKPRTYICSTCGEVGHNKRTCTFTPDIPPLVPVPALHHSSMADLSPAPQQSVSTPNTRTRKRKPCTY
jgi:DNA-directed RNA polymerase subunit RPC12/RpoP